MSSPTNSAVSLRDFAGLFFALTAIASVAVLLFSLLGKQEDADLGIGHSRALYRESQELLISSAEANTNVRNYIMTRDPRYLKLYQKSKIDLQNETKSLIASTNSRAIQDLLRRRLSPAQQAFAEASDMLVTAQPANLQSLLLRQEVAGAAFNSTIQSVQREQSKILRDRNDVISQITDNLALLRVIILLVAFVAIAVSIVTLRAVMKKDRDKIISLEEAITRTQLAERAAHDALNQARRSNELKAQFMANISHEIRTPMTGILGVADLLCLADPPLDDENAGYAKLLMQSSQQLLGVLDDLLNFSQLQKGTLALHLEPFAIRKTIEDLLQSAKNNAAQKNLPLTLSIGENVPQTVVGDEERVRQVSAAILSNSIEFTESGEVQIIVADTGEGNAIKITVRDTGIGIAEADLDKIFLPFVQVDGSIRRAHDGSGLSLCIAKHLVELMDGQIGFSSKVGEGSEFWFTLPGGKNNEQQQ